MTHRDIYIVAAPEYTYIRGYNTTQLFNGKESHYNSAVRE
jgi:hypothetical protein